MTHICLLGGGFGGLYTALELCQLPWKTPPTVTLVDRNERFVFLPLLYELLTGEMQDWEVAPPYSELLAEAQRKTAVKLQFRQDTVEAIDLNTRHITLGSGESLTYDYLTLALGSDTPLQWVPGAAEYAIPFRQLADVYRLRQSLTTWEDQARERGIPSQIAIIGAGASGVELACKFADRLGSLAQITLLERGSDILGGFSDGSIQAAHQALSQRGITLKLNTQVLNIQADSLEYRPGESSVEQISVDGVLWTAGTQPIPLVQSLDLGRDNRQRILVQPTLQTTTRPEVFALGDLAAVIDAHHQPVPATAQAAFQQSGYCAWNIWAQATQERPLLPFRYEALGEMLSLGTDTAVLSSLGLTLTGSLGYLARRTVYLVRMPTLDHQIRVGWNWITRPFQDLLQPQP